MTLESAPTWKSPPESLTRSSFRSLRTAKYCIGTKAQIFEVRARNFERSLPEHTGRGSTVRAAGGGGHPEQQRLLPRVGIEVADDLLPGGSQRTVAFVADDELERPGVVALLAPHQRLHRRHDDIGVTASAARTLLDLDAQPGQVLPQRARSLVQDFSAVRNEQDPANGALRAQRLDDIGRDHGLAGPGRQVEQHAPLAVFPVARHHRAHGRLLVRSQPERSAGR